MCAKTVTESLLLYRGLDFMPWLSLTKCVTSGRSLNGTRQVAQWHQTPLFSQLGDFLLSYAYLFLLDPYQFPPTTR